MLRKVLLAALIAAVPAAAHAGPACPDMSGYQALLDQYVSIASRPGQPLDTRFDYEQLYVDEKIWTLKTSARLTRLHEEMLDARPSAMTPAERVAWGINTYNLLVIERVTNHLLRPGRGFQRYKSVDEIGRVPGFFFRYQLAEVEGRKYSLDQFQRVFIFGDSTPERTPRRPLRDPRLLFVAVPGSMGGPPLLPRAYRPDSLERQLDFATRTAMALPRFVTVKTNPGLLLVSDWLARNRADLGGTPQGILDFVRRWVPRPVRLAIEKGRFTEPSRYVDVDPLLNQKEKPKLIMPVGPDGEVKVQ